MLNLNYPLKSGTYHRVRGFNDHPIGWKGIDDGCVVGTEVIACEDGFISNTQQLTIGGGWNFRLNLTRYPGYFIWYAHCSQIPTNGQVFSRGQVLAHSGATGGVTGPHLHWSLLKGSTPLDPETNATFTEGGAESMITDADNEYGRWNRLFTQIRGREATRDEFRAAAVGKTWLTSMEILSDDPEADRAFKAQETGQVALRDNWEGQITALTNQVNTVLAQLGGANEQIKLLQTTTEAQEIQIKDLEEKLANANKPGPIPVEPTFANILELFRQFIQKWIK